MVRLYLWNLLLTQHGYIVMSVDNRGTATPRGRAWRKIVYGEVGVTAVADQTVAARSIGRMSFVDSTRMGVWGWSGGGSITLGDDNVHYQNTEAVVNALVAANKPFTMMVYPNRTHCICEGDNTSLHLFTLLTRYVDEHLGRRYLPIQ